MTNYNKFYNAWQNFAKPKRQLLVEDESQQFELAKTNSANFLKLTVPPGELDDVLAFPNKSEEERNKYLNTKEPEFDIQRRALRIYPKLYDIIKTDPPQLILVPKKPLSDGTPVYQVDQHHGRARNLAHLMYTKNFNNAKLTAKIFLKDGKKLADLLQAKMKTGKTGAIIQGQDSYDVGAGSVKINIEDLISEIPADSKESNVNLSKEEIYNKAVESLKNKINNISVYRRPIYSTGAKGESADLKISALISEAFNSYQDMQHDANNSALTSIQRLSLRQEFAKEMNKILEIKNKDGEPLIIVAYKSLSGLLSFGLRKPGNEDKIQETPEEEAKKDEVTFKVR